jgi:two-component system chemotaxis sensor kinase CheA
MSDFNPQEFFQDFLDETGEHLRSVHQNLLALEESLSPGNGQIDTVVNRVGLINELFRSFHTIKGLSAMVGLEPAAEVSHSLESILKGIQQAKIEVTSELIDQLLQGAHLLEEATGTLRNPSLPMPSTREYLDKMAKHLPDNTNNQAISTKGEMIREEKLEKETVLPAPQVSNDDIDRVLPENVRKALNENDRLLLQKAVLSGQSIALAVFAPNAQKSAQNINVNDIRYRLSQAGTLIKAVPLVTGDQIRFAFLVASQTPLAAQDFPKMEWTTITGEMGLSGPAQLSKTPSRPDTPAKAEDQPAQVAAPTVRVDLERLDDLMRLVGDLYVCRTRISDNLQRLTIDPDDKQQAAILDTIQQATIQLDRNLRELRRATTRARMVPLSEVFGHMPLAVRDLARTTHKEVRLVMEGENVEIDRVLVERLLDPLLHLVRNAITHGIETPTEREAAGKPPQGILTLRGQPAGDHILVSISDDGRGIDFERIARKAVDAGLWSEEELRLHGPLNEADALELISLAGFSTRESADLGAGRGIGLDVVARMVAGTGGSLTMHSQPGQGTTFTIRLPLTLTILNAILVRCGEERYAVNLDPVDEVIEIAPQEIVHIESGELYPYQGNSLVLIRLSDLFNLPPPTQPRSLYALVGGQSDRKVGLVVDQLISLHEVVVRTISDPLIARPGITGATELGDGSVILILDLPALFQFAASISKEARHAR